MIDFIIDAYNDERQAFPNLADVTIISPVRKGPVGTVNLNILIQEMLCPESITGVIAPKTGEFIGKGHPIKTSIYGNATNYTHLRVGDIVINTMNKPAITTFKMTNDDYWNGTIVPNSAEKGIVNGDTGRIIAYRPSYIDSNGDEVHEHCIVQFFNNRFCNLDIVEGDFESFELAYAITVHKSQGSEYENVIYVSPKSMLNYSEGFATRNLIYTAITRAKQKVTIIGNKDSINYCITHNLPDTNTNFKERLQ
jgi:exodeoxyribonuclease V alpha subunit